ncbi:helix-turn-helix transcriptional regulator [Shumkonia mesophila]|uniref:helix-turn-helix transcriptional regulator n=1 Tax=Shumkonia mesophila TaxID=2838854 RepID=UPI0029351E53|nr:helix-turn-helix transcriptional regulator [Shumkonia mesophila]
MDTHLLDHLKRTADAIVAVFGSHAEVVVHDFSHPDHAVVHVAGNLTGREVGAPVSHFPFRIVKEQGDDAEDVLGYKNVTSKGRVLKCSTVFVRDDEGHVVGCLSINFDVSEYMRLNAVLAEHVEFSPVAETTRKEFHTTTFPETVESIIDGIVGAFGKAPSDLSKEDRLKIVADLGKAGVFMYKGTVQYVADALGTSRYTIYGYLRETKAEPADSTAE